MNIIIISLQWLLFYNWKDFRFFAGGDYGYSTYSNFFAFSGTPDVCMCITVNIVNDDLIEDFKLLFANFNLESYASRVIIDPSLTTIRIFGDASM